MLIGWCFLQVGVRSFRFPSFQTKMPPNSSLTVSSPVVGCKRHCANPTLWLHLRGLCADTTGDAPSNLLVCSFGTFWDFRTTQEVFVVFESWYSLFYSVSKSKCPLWSVRLWFACQWTPSMVPVTVLPSSMTEQSNFEDVPFSMLG